MFLLEITGLVVSPWWCETAVQSHSCFCVRSADDSSGFVCRAECRREDGAHHPRRKQHPAHLLQQEGVRGASHRVPAARDRSTGTTEPHLTWELRRWEVAALRDYYWGSDSDVRSESRMSSSRLTDESDPAADWTLLRGVISLLSFR